MELILLHSNDTHGYLMPLPSPDGEPLGGYARRATFIVQQRAAHANVLLLDVGDFYQSSRYWHAFRGEPDITLMNMLGYDAAALGNHDFDGGLDLLAARLQQAEFPVLCANMQATRDHPLGNAWQPSLIKTIEGVRIALFSLLVDVVHLYPPDFPHYITCTSILETASALVPQLREQADFVILLSHLGHTDDIKVATHIEGIDLIIGGHTHTALPEPMWINETPIVRGMVGTQAMGRMQLTLEPGQQLVLNDYRLVPLDASFDDDLAVVAELAQWQAKLPAEETLGQLVTPLDTRQDIKASGESTAGNFYADALLAYAEAEVPQAAAALAFVHMGTLRGDRVYGPGNFTNHDLSEYHPFPNPPLLRRLTAPQLKQFLEQGVSHLPYPGGIFLSHTGLSVTVDLSQQAQTIDLSSERILSPGARIVRADYQGTPIDFSDSSQTFIAILDGFMGQGGAGYFFLRESQLIQHLETSGSDVVRWYLRQHSPITTQIEGRIVFV